MTLPEVGGRRRVEMHLLHVNPLVYELLARRCPADLVVAADQEERLAGDVHAAGVVAGPVQIFLTVHAGVPKPSWGAPQSSA